MHASTSALGGAHEPAYVHAKHMYNLGEMTNRKLKFGVAVSGALVTGLGIPVFAVWFAQWKAKA
eukprot:CAMPEP_0196574736 /NCGR_PEP_ID=MMETSP1081-20130531/4386_1 /TAXON_ID=36882 /ORGANISM="Pyramimonas amylifera, Strain CCMP720" /LENGTH=63 /DNA_ID=CAMNT_0041892845 /DNA_START=172 /DNA_END=363 /DNA_ORIENTATION=+